MGVLRGEGGLGCSFLPSPGKNLRTAMIIGFDSSYELLNTCRNWLQKDIRRVWIHLQNMVLMAEWLEAVTAPGPEKNHFKSAYVLPYFLPNKVSNTSNSMTLFL
jgi:hypothetical protein